MNLFSMSQAPLLQASDGTLLREVFHPRHTGIETPYSVAQAMLPPGQASLPHALVSSHEVYIILAGQGRVRVNDDEEEVRAGDIVHIPAGATQCVENTGEEQLIFMCVVSPPWHAEDEEER